jgi:hypothetical protein
MTPDEKAERRKFIALDDDELAEAERVSEALHTWLAGRRVRWALGTVACVVIGGLLAVLSAGVIRNVNRLDALQRADSDGARTAGYRTCVRQDVERLELHLSARQRPGDRAIARARLRRDPILDCSPLLVMRDSLPKPLPRREQVRATRFYGRTYRVPIIRSGHVRLCPDRNDAQAPVTRWANVRPACFGRGRDIGH